MYPFLTLLVVALLVYCILDIALADPQQVRNLPRLAWLFIVLVLPLIGSVAWLAAGRPAPSAASTHRRGPVTGRAATRRPGQAVHPSQRPASPRGPDDDPEFLRDVAERLRRQRPRPEDET